MNYLELTNAITDYTQNFEQSFVNNISTFVKMAEDKIYNSAEFPALQKTAYSYTAPGSKLILSPPDMLAVFSLAVKKDDNFVYLLPKDISWLNEANTNDQVTGMPIYYAIYSDSIFQLGPVPDATYYIECNYFYKPPSITVDGTTWLGNNMPSVLLYGSLVEAYTYMKGEDDLINRYKTSFSEGMETLKNLGEGRDRLDAFRSGLARTREKA